MDISIAVIIMNLALLASFIKYCKTTNSQYKWWHIVLIIFFGVFIFVGWFIFYRDL